MTKTKVLKIDRDSSDKSVIGFAAELLRNGGLVAFPTETVYGIGANFLDKKAIKKLYEVKKRPLNKPFTVHISSLDTIAEMQCEISPPAERLIKEFWPGPLTVVLKCTLSTPGVEKRFQGFHPGGGKGTLGFRMPRNRIAKELISESGIPVAAPSANVSGEKAPAEAGEILKKFDGKIDLILDSGKTQFSRESTIVDATKFPCKILREGAIPESEIRRVLDELS